MNVTRQSYVAGMAAVVYLRMSPALRSALHAHAAANGVSLRPRSPRFTKTAREELMAKVALLDHAYRVTPVA